MIDLPMDVLFGKPPRMHRDAKHLKPRVDLVPDLSGIGMEEALMRVLRLPTVGSKSFLITIGDRSVGGLCARDPMVGPWQVPVADCAVTLLDFDGYKGEAMAMAERAPVAVLNSADAARLAVGEAITNLAAAPIDNLGEVRLSANWMAAVNHPGEDAALFDAVKAVGMELCPELDISIPVGKDSLSMQTVWKDGDTPQRTISPVSLVITGFARVSDVRRTLTPQLRLDRGDSDLWLIDLGAGRARLGGSALTQVFNRGGGVPPDLDDAKCLKALFDLVQEANRSGLLLAYHDRSDGGVIVTLLEMAFAGRCGLEITLDGWAEAALRALFNEELGAVLQVACGQSRSVRSVAGQAWPCRHERSHRPSEREAWHQAVPQRRHRVQVELDAAVQGVERNQLRHAAPARQPAQRRCGIRLALSMTATWAFSRSSASIRPKTLPRHISKQFDASTHRDPARAGRQWSGGNGCGLYARRFRRGGRAYVRSR